MGSHAVGVYDVAASGNFPGLLIGGVLVDRVVPTRTLLIDRPVAARTRFKADEGSMLDYLWLCGDRVGCGNGDNTILWSKRTDGFDARFPHLCLTLF
ncbi:hypothetical protein JB92DRAFT_2889853 [Gautieria morchelliformis]|nr:hypothetical protein JB92DRAFT_2889853 [Gautieria morchelliformis]